MLLSSPLYSNGAAEDFAPYLDALLIRAKIIRTVELRTLFSNPFWKYLGYKTEEAVRHVLREADVKGLIGKYVVAEQIEQVTTSCALDDWLERRIRL